MTVRKKLILSNILMICIPAVFALTFGIAAFKTQGNWPVICTGDDGAGSDLKKSARGSQGSDEGGAPGHQQCDPHRGRVFYQEYLFPAGLCILPAVQRSFSVYSSPDHAGGRFYESVSVLPTIFEVDTRRPVGNFLKKAFENVLPFALTVTAEIILLSLAGPFGQAANQELMYLLLVLISMGAVVKSCIPFTRLRVFLCVTMALGLFGSAAFLISAGAL